MYAYTETYTNIYRHTQTHRHTALAWGQAGCAGLEKHARGSFYLGSLTPSVMLHWVHTRPSFAVPLRRHHPPPVTSQLSRARHRQVGFPRHSVLKRHSSFSPPLSFSLLSLALSLCVHACACAHINMSVCECRYSLNDAL